MNVKKLSLASLFLVLSCSFGFAETFVKVTKMTQIVPGNRYVMLCQDRYDRYPDKTLGYAAFAQGNYSDKFVKVYKSGQGSNRMYLIKTDVNTTGSSSNNTPLAMRLAKTQDGKYTFESTAEADANAPYLTMEDNNGKLSFSTTPTGFTIRESDFTFTNSMDELEGGLFFVGTDAKGINFEGEGNERSPQFKGVYVGNNPAIALYVESDGDVNGETPITFRRATSADATDQDYYATTYYEKDFKLDDHVTAYGITQKFTEPIVGEVTLTLTDALATPTEFVWAKSPVLLVVPNEYVEVDSETGEKPETVTYPIYLVKTNETAEPFSTNLTGTAEEITTAPEGSYVLGMLEGEIVFGKAPGGIPAHRAYIQLAEGSEVKSFTFNFNKSTGIKAVSAPEVNNDAIYNLIGQRVSKNYKGVVVKNGKKFLNK